MPERCASTLMIRTTVPTYIRCQLLPDHGALCRGVMPGVAEFKEPDGVVMASSTVRVMLTWKAA